MDDDDLTRRAMSAYFRTDQTVAPPIPSSNSGVVELNGKHYVVLLNVNGVLAVYRVRPQGILKRLKRWPAELAEW
jgi:hypothetical protein